MFYYELFIGVAATDEPPGRISERVLVSGLNLRNLEWKQAHK